MAADVLEEDAARARLDDDAPDVRPEMALVVLAAALAGGAERLTRVSRREDIHDATPASAVECGKVGPDRSVIQGRIFHPCHEGGRCRGFPLDETDSAIPGLCEVQAEIQSANSRAQGEAVDGSACGGM